MNRLKDLLPGRGVSIPHHLPVVGKGPIGGFRWGLFLALVCALACQGGAVAEESDASEKIIFGEDHRRDVYEVTDPDILRLSELVCMVIDRSRIRDNGNGTYSLLGAAPWLNIRGVPICQSERFIGQPQMGFCSAFLVGEDLVATAGHCIGPTDRSGSDCPDVVFVFGFEQLGNGNPPPLLIPEEQVYFCAGYVDHDYNQDRDHSVIRLDRPVEGVAPLPLRREGNVSLGDPLVLIGHPGGLPKKIADNATVKDPRPGSFLFNGDVDYLGGSSGGLVANLNDFTIEGIMASGPVREDYVTVGGCIRTTRCSPEEGCPGFAGISKTSGFAHAIPEVVSSKGAVRSDRNRYNHQGTIEIEVRDKDLRGAGSLAIAAVTSVGDSENLGLVERPSGSGVFEGFIPPQLLAGPLTPNRIGDGFLQVIHGAAVEFRYSDADNGTGAPETVVKTVAIDLEPPSLSDLELTQLGGTFAGFKFLASEPVWTLVSFATFGLNSGCNQFNRTYRDGTLSGAVNVLLTQLQPNLPYFLEIEITDEAGNSTTVTNGDDCFTITTSDRIDQWTEFFSDSDNDLENVSILFTPSDSASSYDACVLAASGFPTDPAGGEVLLLNDDDSAEVLLQESADFPFYGQSYRAFHIGSNGTLSFGEPDAGPFASLEEHFRIPRVSALFHDLIPEDAVSWKQTGDRVAVTYDGARDFETNGANRFQVELFFDGAVRLTYLQVESTEGVVGLSKGAGILPDFVEKDFSSLEDCPPPGSATPTPTVAATPTPTPTISPTPTLNPTPGPTWIDPRSDGNEDGLVDAMDLFLLSVDWLKVSGP